MQKMAEESAFNSPLEIDTRTFMWTFHCLDEDHELERFFSGLPGFRRSKMVKDPLLNLESEDQEKLLQTLIGLSDRTSSSDLLLKKVKIQRTDICQKAIGPADIPNAISWAFDRITSEDQYGPVQSAEIADLVRGWDNGKDFETMMIRAVVSSIVARAQQCNDTWFTLAAHETGVLEKDLQDHATCGNNLSLAVLIHIVRQQFNPFEEHHWPESEFSKVLEAASKFDVLKTSPELQNEFCVLWNQIVHTGIGGIPSYILKPIRNVYLTLHPHTDCALRNFSTSTSDKDPILSQSSIYPPCDDYVSTSTATHCAVLHDNAAPFLATTSVRIDGDAVDMPQINNILVSSHSSSRAHQTATENFPDSATSPDLTAAVATRDNPSARIMAPTILAASTLTSFVAPPTEGSFQNNANLLAPHSGSPEILSSTSPELVLENIISTGKPPTLTIPCPNLTICLTQGPIPQ